MSIAIRLADSDVVAEAQEGDLILDALLLAGVAMPYSCQQGNCGTCKCELVDGEIMELDYSEYALTAEDRAKNLVLACRTQAWGDVTVRKLDDEELIVHPERFMRCKVEALEDLTHDIKRVLLRIESGGPFTFTAGQYAKTEFIPLVTRDYSMANVPGHSDAGLLEFHIRAVPGGNASKYVHETLVVGQGVRVNGPYGSSYLRESHGGPILAIAGGSGLAPVESIIGRALAAGATQPIHLYFGVRAQRDVYHEELFRQWAARHPNFRYTIVLSNEEVPGYAHGLVTDVAARELDQLGDAAGMKAYLAGPPVMVEAATALLTARGVAGRDIHADAFYTEADRQAHA
jgi:CDP-4-dehydro-6-deoxyglucose reductase/ferredoxin-NAD(P)+ reductase (naphthalene dioxygenase ferredoxin-specific)